MLWIDSSILNEGRPPYPFRERKTTGSIQTASGQRQALLIFFQNILAILNRFVIVIK